MPKRNERNLFLGLIALGMALASWPAVSAGGQTGTGAAEPAFGEVCIRTVCFSVEVANTRPAREAGLMGRESLAANHGLLLTYPDERLVSIWMKNMKIPIDAIWIGADERVTGIATRLDPCLSESCSGRYAAHSARYVLEVNAGTADEYAIAVGDPVAVRFEKPIR